MGLTKKAQTLFDDRFLFRASQKVRELGVIGEERNKLAGLVGCISRECDEPVSFKGTTGSGKTRQFKAYTQMFPQSCVIERAGLSEKALAYGKDPLARRILFINEYRCGRDAQQLLRLLQSDGEIK